MSNYKIIVSAGGTGGHIIPALNVCCALRAKGIEVFYIGNKKSMEETIIQKHDFSFLSINVQKLYRSYTIKHLFFPFKLLISILVCLKYFIKIRPLAYIGFGGYVSGPPAIVAKLLHCPIYIQEQNAKPGITNIWVGKFAQKVFLGFLQAQIFFPPQKCIESGNPIQVCMHPQNKIEFSNNLSVSHFKDKKLRLLVLGGSQGSKFINDLILEHLDWLLEKEFGIFWQTGINQFSEIKDIITNKSGITAFSFTDKIQDYYAFVDCVISRGGAMSLSEIITYKLPVFTIPLEYGKSNEQLYNAQYIEDNNLGIMFRQRHKSLFQEIFQNFYQKVEQHGFTHSIESLHHNAAHKIVEIIVKEMKIYA